MRGLACLFGFHKYTMFELHYGRIVYWCTGSNRCIAKGRRVIEFEPQ